MAGAHDVVTLPWCGWQRIAPRENVVTSDALTQNRERDVLHVHFFLK